DGFIPAFPSRKKKKQHEKKKQQQVQQKEVESPQECVQDPEVIEIQPDDQNILKHICAALNGRKRESRRLRINLKHDQNLDELLRTLPAQIKNLFSFVLVEADVTQMSDTPH